MKKLSIFIGISVFSAILLANNVADTRISFYTEGPDRYSDGTVVLDGESYALVWSKDGQFDGFTASGRSVDAQDKVLLIAPIAKGGRCPSVLFQVPVAQAEELAGGEYAVYLLDTRISSGESVQPGSSSGVVNAYGSATENVPASSTPTGVTVPELENTPKGQVASTPVGWSGVDTPLFIKAIRVEEEKVFLTVENRKGFMRVSYGADLLSPNLNTPAVETSGESEDVVLEAGKTGEKSFYRVIHTGN